MRLSSDLLQINIISQFHVLSVDTQYLQSTSRIRDTNVYLTIKPKGGGGGPERSFNYSCNQLLSAQIKHFVQPTDLPNRLRAGSMLFGRLVAAMMIT